MKNWLSLEGTVRLKLKTEQRMTHFPSPSVGLLKKGGSARLRTMGQNAKRVGLSPLQKLFLFKVIFNLIVQ